MNEVNLKIPIPIPQKTIQSMLLDGDGIGSGRRGVEEVRFMFVALGDGNYHTLALLWITIFDFCMV